MVCGWTLWALSLLGAVALCSGAAVMSIDLGSEWIKVGVVSPGVPMDIALNRESKRKSPAAVAMRDGERTFGEEAVGVGARFPALSYQYLLPLAGKTLDSPVVRAFQQTFPYYRLEADPDRGTVLFRHDDEQTFSVEELLAMQLAQARQTAAEHLQQPVTDAVVTVPAHCGQSERRAVLAAAQLADVKVLQLMNDNAAVALNYGMFRRSSFNSTAQLLLFYDMGAASTAASLVSYQLVKTRERGFTETNPQLQILGYGYDRSLGGLAMTLRLRDHLAKLFTASKKTPLSVYESPRALAKLTKEAERVKKILSANAETSAQVEGLLDEEDFRAHVTRVEFEELCADLFDRVTAPLQMALRSAGVTLDLVDQLILAGAGTRVPRVQDLLAAEWGRELGKSVNTDEAAALGAVYRAADLSAGFKVMKFHVKDYVLLPIGVDFERESEPAAEGDAAAEPQQRRLVHRNLFTLGNPYPQKKVITFNRSQRDFGFSVNYADLSHLSADERLAVGGQNLSHVQLHGVADIFAEHTGAGVESKGLKVHFQLDDSGVLNLTSVEAVFEKTSGAAAAAEEEEAKAAGDEGTLAKLSSAFGKLFSGDESKEASQDKPSAQEDAPSDQQTDSSDSKDKDADTPKPDTSSNTTDGADVNATASSAADAAKGGRPKVRVVKVPVRFTSVNLNVPELEGERLQAARDKIAALDEADRQRNRREAARNALEAFSNDITVKLYDELYEESSTEEEREQLQKAASEMGDWLYEEGFDESAAVYEEKLQELRRLTRPLYERVEEHRSRADAVQALNDILNMTQHFLVQANESVQQGVVTESDVSALQKMVTTTEAWLQSKLEEQAATAMTSAPKLRVRALAEKYASLEKEVKFVVNKMKAGAARKAREEADAKAKEILKQAEAAAKAAAENETASESGDDSKAEAAEPGATEEPADGSEEPAGAAEENDTEADKRKEAESTPTDTKHEEL